MNALSDEWGPPGQGTFEQLQQQEKSKMRASLILGGKQKNQSVQLQGSIPFLGCALRDLAVTQELPTFLDPSSPSAPCDINPEQGTMNSMADPSAFQTLPLLPEGLIFPLVNVHKFRTIASVVSKVLVFQEMSSLYAYEAEPTLFRQCLGLKCLPEADLHSLSHICEA